MVPQSAWILAVLCLLTSCAEGFRAHHWKSVPRSLSRITTEATVGKEKYANPVTGILGSFLPTTSDDLTSQDPFYEIDWETPKAKGLSLNQLADRLDAGLEEAEWFVTGRVLPELFSDDFEFIDPDVTLQGIKPYAEGVRRIFDQATSRVEIINCSVTAGGGAAGEGLVVVAWRLSGRVNLGPVGLALKPYVVTTTFTVEKATGLVVRQEDEFSIPPWDILLSALLPPAVAEKLPFLAAPAPPPAPRPRRKFNGGSGGGKGMQRPLLDSLATFLFKMESSRVDASSETDTLGRDGEPMAWAEAGSLANRLSKVMASGPGYAFKQLVADLVAGEFDEAQVSALVDSHIALSTNTNGPSVALFSFTTCPFCRKAKDFLDEQGISYVSLELDEQDNGNALRPYLGRKTKRTSVPSIFIRGECIGGCNDGPGLLPLAASGELQGLLQC